MKVSLPLLKNVLTPLAKNVIIPLRLTAAASAADSAIQEKIFGSWSTLIISNEKMDDIMKIVQSLEGSGLLMKVVSETIKNEVKEPKGGFLNMLLGTLAAIALGNMLTVKGVIGAGEGTIRVGQDF